RVDQADPVARAPERVEQRVVVHAWHAEQQRDPVLGQRLHNRSRRRHPLHRLLLRHCSSLLTRSGPGHTGRSIKARGLRAMRLIALTVLAAAWLPASAAMAQVKIGLTISTTGPAASLGVPQKNSISLLPTEIAGQKIEYIVLDDGA